jgi:hypothetical protein
MILIERLLPPKLFAGHGDRDLALYKIKKDNVYFQAQAWQTKEIESEVSISGMIDAGGGPEGDGILQGDRRRRS